jgi:hypothetical protein
VWLSCAIALVMRSVRIPHPLHSSELSRTRPGSSAKSSSPYRPPLIVLVLELVLVLVLFWIYTEGHGRVLLSMALFSGHLNRVWLRRQKPRTRTSSRTITIMGNEVYRQGKGSASLISAT